MQTTQGRKDAVHAYVQLGLGYIETGNTQEAKVPLKKALELDPNDANAHAALALAFQAEMEPKMAETEYQAALKQSPSDTRILNNYGTFLYEYKRYPEALKTFEKAAKDEMYPERSRLFENIGLTELQMGNKARAKEDFIKSLRLSANQPRVLLELSQMFYEEGNNAQADQFYKQFLATNPQQTPRSLLLGIRLSRIMNDRNSEASYELQLKRLYPGSREFGQLNGRKG